MAPVIPDPKKIKSFRSESDFEQWLAKNHATESELWLKIFKKDSGKTSVTNAQAIDVALCWGWIDGLRKGLDELAFLQRFTPRQAKSVWSQINRDKVAALVKAGRMTQHGKVHVDAAKADGRWDAAYAPMRNASAESLPKDLMNAIEANAKALMTFQTLGRQNLFSLGFRVNSLKTPAGRARKIETLVAMLARGETIAAEPKRKS